MTEVNIGYWEGDLVVGKEGKGAALLTFTERMTREEIIIKIPSKHAINIAKSIDKLERKYKSEFKKKFKTITFDNGVEFRDYKAIEKSEAIKHLCRFTSNIWQIHPFCEGNTRTIAVFIIKYLRTFGFKINDEVFADNSWYFRNALVRANYTNFQKKIFEDTSFIEKFFYNLLTNSTYELKNRYTHIDNIQSKNENNLKGNNCTLEEQAIINILKVNPEITQEEIANQINKSVRTVKTYMAEMQKKGLIERKNGKKNGKWQVNA